MKTNELIQGLIETSRKQRLSIHESAIVLEAADKLAKCKAFFDEEIDSLSKNWNKLYREAKEACE